MGYFTCDLWQDGKNEGPSRSSSCVVGGGGANKCYFCRTGSDDWRLSNGQGAVARDASDRQWFGLGGCCRLTSFALCLQDRRDGVMSVDGVLVV